MGRTPVLPIGGFFVERCYHPPKMQISGVEGWRHSANFFVGVACFSDVEEDEWHSANFFVGCRFFLMALDDKKFLALAIQG